MILINLGLSLLNSSIIHTHDTFPIFSITGNPAPEIIWVRSDGTAVGDVPGLRQVLSNGNLVFPPFQAEDYRQEVHAQVYACLAKNQFGSIISRDVNVRAGKKHFFDNTFFLSVYSFSSSMKKYAPA